MGIESEKLVYDYLSRVGDLAQQQGLSSGERMRLVSGLRADIDHRRATGGADSPAGVKRILSKLGSPADVVAAPGGRPPDPGPGAGGAPGAGNRGGARGGGPAPPP
ncbi:HAAS signaling domain-containing protein, partial [Streptomyces hygroscopicus]|uniref:HAAS signaling domain-containing protein n=1 Tax=Streptomyces hygroscopicus TaxID=1912 RepID=UPI003679EA97